jgi:predicted extracellular nuclease
MATMTRYSRFLCIGLILLSGAFVSAFAQKEYKISEIQGDKGTSAHVGENVRTTGVVTAIVAKGFYMQTPDGQADNDPKTSEGIYVYGENSVGKVSVGAMVQVDGTVVEFRPRSEKIFLSITEISRPTVTVISKDNPLPAPIVLTAAELDPRGRVDQMERFEGMRVKADIVVVGPTIKQSTAGTTTDGIFFATVQGTPRPFREPGIDILTKIFEKLPETTPAYDMNPEILRVESNTQKGTKPIYVPAGATIKGLTGVIDYSKKFFTLMADPTQAAPENVKGFVAVSPAAEREVTVASFNIENFFDDEVNSKDVEKEATVSKEEFQGRMNKASLAIRNVLSMPDVIGIVEVENLKVLQKLADKINADAVAAKQPDPKYVAYLEDGNDVRGIDNGFLVKSAKVKVIETKQLGGKEKLNYGTGFPDEKLFDRPPFLLKAEVADTKLGKPFAFTVIVNHFKSYRGIDDDKDGDRVRNKRRLEAEWLGNFIQERAKVDPAERLLVCGDFNAFQFNDGYNDLIGILKGKSDPNVLVPSKTAYTTGLKDLIDSMPNPNNRYSYVFDGSAQALDHMLVNKPVYMGGAIKFGYARVDADFPLIWADDYNRPERLSDHDAPVVFMSMDPLPPAPKPVATPSPSN